MTLPTRFALLSVLAAFLVGIAFLPTLALAQVQVPNPTPRPQVVPNPKAALPTPAVAATTSTATTTAAKAAADPVDIPAAGSYPHGRVIVLRGLGNVFSRGMDAMAKDLKARGVNVNLQNHSRWQPISAQLISDYRANPGEVGPVILIGHSLGGDAVIVMSNWLIQNRVPVRLVVVFDAVGQIHPIDAGVEEVVNFYKPKGYGKEVKGSPNFAGTINNVDLTDRTDIDHLNIDKDPVIQQEVIARVMTILAAANGGKPVRKAAPVAKTTPPAETPPTTTAAAAPGDTPATAEATPSATPAPTATAPQETAAVAVEPVPPTPAPEPVPAAAAD